MKTAASKVATTARKVVSSSTVQDALQNARTLSNMTTGSGTVTGAQQPDQQRIIFPGRGKSVPDQHVVPGLNNASTASQAPLGERAPVSGGSNNASAAEPTTSSNSQSDNSSPRAADVAQPRRQKKKSSHRSGQRQQARSAQNTEMTRLTDSGRGHATLNVNEEAAAPRYQDIPTLEAEIKKLDRQIEATSWFWFLKKLELKGKREALANIAPTLMNEAEQEKQSLTQSNAELTAQIRDLEQRDAELTAQIRYLKQSDAAKVDSLKVKLTQEGKLERAAVIEGYLTACTQQNVSPSLEGLARYATKTITELKATVKSLKDELSNLKTQVQEMDERHKTELQKRDDIYKVDKKQWEDDLQAEREDHGKTKKALEVANGKITQLETDLGTARDDIITLKQDRNEARAEIDQMRKDHAAEIQELRDILSQMQQERQVAKLRKQPGVDQAELRMDHFANTAEVLMNPSNRTIDSPLPSPPNSPQAKAAVPPAAPQQTTAIPDDWETVAKPKKSGVRAAATAAGKSTHPTFSQGK